MMKTLKFGRLFLFSPAKAAAACERPDALRLGLVIYAEASCNGIRTA